MSFSIGDFDFVSLTPMLADSHQRIAIEARPGIDGFALWQTGKRGEPQQLMSFRDAPNLSVAQQLYRAYLTLIGGEAVQLRFAGITAAQKVDVLDVRPAPEGVKRILAGFGGLEGTSFAICTCVWTVLPHNPPEEEA